MGSKRLLVVDDEPFNLEIIADHFDDSGLELDTATNGERAWEQLNNGTAYAAVLLDRMMPVLDGISLLRRIKADPRFAAIPVIMQTAAGDPEQVREGLAAGAYYYLVKPYERDSLLTIVRGALADSEARANLQRRLAEHGSALQLLASGEFRLHTVDEAGALAAFLAQACPQPERAVLGLSELLVNSVEHGNLGITYAEKSRLRQQDRWLDEVHSRQALPENRDKRVRVAVSRQAASIVIRISDEGSGFDWRQYLDFAPERAFDPNGRGIALARASGLSALDYEGCGNTVVVTIDNPH